MEFFLVSSRYFVKAGFTVTEKAGIVQAALQNLDVVEGKVVLDAEAGIGLDVEADIIVAGVRFNLAIKSDIYAELTEKACILLRI